MTKGGRVPEELSSLIEPEHVGPPPRDFLADGVDGRAVTDTKNGGNRDDRHAPVHTSLFS